MRSRNAWNSLNGLDDKISQLDDRQNRIVVIEPFYDGHDPPEIFFRLSDVLFPDVVDDSCLRFIQVLRMAPYFSSLDPLPGDEG